jgi:LDH2 family malate/lactate/ureidoglycolate dehydrogenase
MFLAIDPEKLAGLDHFISRSEWYLSTIKNSRRADPASEIRIPGERASETIRVQSRDGIRLLAETWDIVGRYAKKFGVSPPAVLEPEVSTSWSTPTSD